MKVNITDTVTGYVYKTYDSTADAEADKDAWTRAFPTAEAVEEKEVDNSEDRRTKNTKEAD